MNEHIREILLTRKLVIIFLYKNNIIHYRNNHHSFNTIQVKSIASAKKSLLKRDIQNSIMLFKFNERK